jgi:hypothetical protein
MSPVSAPTREKGVVNGYGLSGNVQSWSGLVDDAEFAPDLRWPASVHVYEKMRSDAQIQGLLSGTILPITRFRWYLEDNGADPAVTDRLSQQLKVPVRGREDEFVLGRTRNRFSWNKHLGDLLRALYTGHYFFEQVGEVEADGSWTLKKLAPRPPRTISEIIVAEDGGLVGIKQYGGKSQAFSQEPDIPVSQLLAYAWDREGGNWTGRSMLRPCFRNWLVKDRLIRIDAGKHERNGMGVPWFEAPEGASQDLIDALDEMAQAYRAGDEAGGAGPHGAKLRLVGTEGSLPDTIGSIRYHDEQMANAFLMMFISLGSTQTGSRALGEVFSDFFGYAQEAVADWAKDTFNEHMIEDWVDWNYGEDAAAPIMTYDRSSEEELPTGDLAVLVDKGIVSVDTELESAIRKRYKLPAMAEPRPVSEEEPIVEGEPEPAATESIPTQAGSGRRSGRVEATPDLPSTVSLPDRPLRRSPYDSEVAATTDYKQLDEQWTARRDTLFEQVRAQQAKQADELAKAITSAAGDLDKLSAIAAEADHADVLLSSAQSAANDGLAQMEAEATRQGHSRAKALTTAQIEDGLAARARVMDKVLTQELSSAASQRAITLTGGGMKPADVAKSVKAYLLELKGARVKKQLNGFISYAMNSGRKLYMREEPPQRVYSSELLDSATCSNCAEVDGTEYATLDEAELDYPSGGYMDCDGGDDCRGTLVAVYEEADTGIGEAT